MGIEEDYHHRDVINDLVLVLPGLHGGFLQSLCCTLAVPVDVVLLHYLHGTLRVNELPQPIGGDDHYFVLYIATPIPLRSFLEMISGSDVTPTVLA